MPPTSDPDRPALRVAPVPDTTAQGAGWSPATATDADAHADADTDADTDTDTDTDATGGREGLVDQDDVVDVHDDGQQGGPGRLSARWLIFPLALLAFVAGVVAGPVLPWNGVTPGEGSVEAGFARDMQLHHQQSIAMSYVAMRAATDDEVRAIALDVLGTQTAQVGQMSGWLADWKLDDTGPLPRMAWMRGGHDSGHTPTGTGHQLLPDGRMPGMASAEQLRTLSAARGVQVDRTYLSLLITHHRGGIPMAAEAVARTNRDSVGALALSIEQSQSAELEVLSNALVRLGGQPPPIGDVTD